MADKEINLIGGRGSLLISLAAFVVVIAGLKAAQTIVVQILIAAFLAVAVAPPVFFLERKKVPYPAALAIVIAGLFGILVFVAGVIGTSVNQFTHQLPAYERRIREMLADMGAMLQEYGFDVELESLVAGVVDPGEALNLAASLFSGIGNVLANSFLILIMAIFLLLEASALPAKLQAAFGDQGRAYGRFKQLGASINRYLVIKTWVSAATGALATVLCMAVGLDYAALWGLLAFLLNYIPNIGSILAGIPPALLALVLLGPGPAVILVIGYTLLNNILGNFVEPRFMGRGLGLSTFAVVVSLVFWGWVLGPVGMLLSIPLTMAVKIAMEGKEETRWIAVLLGDGREAEALAAQAGATGSAPGGEAIQKPAA